jgi:hypothetical protein
MVVELYLVKTCGEPPTSEDGAKVLAFVGQPIRVDLGRLTKDDNGNILIDGKYGK